MNKIRVYKAKKALYKLRMKLYEANNNYQTVRISGQTTIQQFQYPANTNIRLF